MPTVRKITKDTGLPGAPAGVVLRIISSDPAMSAAQLNRRARQVLRAAGLEVVPVSEAKAAVPGADPFALMDAMNAEARQAPGSLTAEQIRVEVEAVRRARYGRKKA